MNTNLISRDATDRLLVCSEIYSKIWCPQARGVLDKHAASAVAMWQAEHDGRLQVSQNEEFCIKKKELCIKNEELCIKNEECFSDGR